MLKKTPEIPEALFVFSTWITYRRTIRYLKKATKTKSTPVERRKKSSPDKTSYPHWKFNGASLRYVYSHGVPWYSSFGFFGFLLADYVSNLLQKYFASFGEKIRSYGSFSCQLAFAPTSHKNNIIFSCRNILMEMNVINVRSIISCKII